MKNPDTVVFDLGGVLVDWNPRHLYRKLIADEAEREWFLNNVCSPDWNVQQDAGRPIAEANAEAIARHPGKADLIRAFYDRFEEMMPGPIQGTVDILERLDAAGTPLYALTNWSAETFPIGKRRFPFLGRFRHVTVSGELKLIKPDPAIFRHVLAQAKKPAEACVFIDDSPKNVEGARALGFHGLHFEGPEKLARELAALGFPA